MLRLVAAAMLVLALAGATAADQTDPRLAGLFARLQATSSPSEARALEQIIAERWLETEDDDARVLVREGIIHMSRGEYSPALAAFNGVVERAPHYAEGWNKRATVHFLMQDFIASIGDIEHTLALEPRHFGALAGLGQIYLAFDQKRLAVNAFDAALRLHPHLAGIRSLVEQLRNEIEGKPT
jgi:tetratricopeptide (TPR) repeat protein